MALRVIAHGASDVGKAREHNEDSFLVDESSGIFVVADGMGGHAAGEVASAKTVEILQASLSKQRALFDQLAEAATPALRAMAQGAVERAILEACRVVHDMGQQDKSKRGMGCTVDCVVHAGNGVVIGHVGDSRVYLLRAGKVDQLTEDHTLVAQLLRAGTMTREELKNSDFRSVLLRGVGTQPSVQVDTVYIECSAGDRLLICSDGLHGYLDDEPDVAKLLSGSDPARLPYDLIALANLRGGDDNITAVIVDFAGQDTAIDATLRHEIMSKTALFEHLSTKEQAAILSVSKVLEVEAGTTLVLEGSPGDDIYVVVRGGVAVIKQGVEIARLGPGGHFGEMGLVDHTPRSATVRATEPSTVLAIQRRELMGVMRKEMAIGVKLLWGLVQTLSDRLRATNSDVVVLHRELATNRPDGPFENEAPRKKT